MNIQDFHRLFRYDDWANREVLNALQDAHSPRALQLFAHVLAAQALWLERLRRRPQPLPVWPALTLNECSTHLAELSRQWPEYLHTTGDTGLAEITQYKNTQGEQWEDCVADILQHVIMHSTYHRGQIAAAMRAGGLKPALTDFIHSVRQGFVE